jgi:outer membrane autotransporter protein
MSRTKKRRGWRWWLLGAALSLTVLLATYSSWAADLTIDGGATYTVTSNLTFNSVYIGNISTGTLNQDSFMNTITGSLFLGYNPGSSGTYNLSGGSLSTTSGEIVGYYGSGVFNQTGGSNATGNLTLGSGTGISGTFNQIDGTNTISGILFLGYNSGGSGVYNLSGGSLSAGFEYIGNNGVGTVNQSGGTNTIDLNLYLGGSPGSSGTYNLDGGSLKATNQLVGYHGNGIFNQNGGSNTIEKGAGLIGLVLGFWNDGNGTYNLNNGSLSGWSEIIGKYGVGTFNQINGTNQVTEDLTLGLGNGLSGSGTYNLSGGNLSADSETIGYQGTGAFNQNGGSNKVAKDLVLGYRTTGTGVYNLSGGTLSVHDEYIAYSGNASFIQTGGVHSVDGNLSLVANPGRRASLAFLGGTLAVGGNYLQNANGSLALGITSASNYQRINIGGTASLNGTLTPVLLGGYRPYANQAFTGVLTVVGGINGTFTLTNPWISPTLYWQQRYNPNSVDLQVARDYNSPGLGLNSNQAAVGAMLNGPARGAVGDLGGVLGAVDNLTTSGEVQDAFKQISPEKARAMTSLGFAGAAFQMRNLATRTTNLRFGSENFNRRVGLGGFDLNYSGQDGIMLAYNGAGLPGLLSAKKEFRAPQSRWGLFVDGGAAFGSQKSSVNQTGYDFTLGGFTAGGDYRVADNLLLGLATGYSHTAAGFQGSGGGVHANTVPFNAYAAYFPGSFYAYGSLGYALNLFDLERGLNFGGLSRTAKSSTTGHQFNVFGETGYDFRVWRYILTPAATLAYSRIWVNAFTEDGAGALNLQVGSQTADSLQTGLGGRLTVPFRAGQVKVLYQAYAFYEHEFANGSRGLNAGLSQGGSTFSFQTDAAPRNFAVVGGSLTLGLKENLWAQVNYNAEVGRGNYTAHFVNAGLRYEF